MATSKQPRLPNPPLEWGIPQYPTPNVPDFYTKQGHIILVEKVSTEKGPYNPQPLDGSVTYSKRDANKWPSTLYLVYQKPDETGQFVYNYYANDRTLASQDPWNYGVSYSTENPDFPIYTRTYITPRNQYATVALGSVDPVFGGTAIMAKQQMSELGEDNPLRSRYVQVQRVYESIPSAVLSGKKLDDRGDIETITTQVVVAGTAPTADGLLVTRTAVEPVDSVKSTKTYGSVASYATLTTKAKKAGLLGTISTTDDIVAPSTNPDELSTTILDSSVEAITATKSRKKTTTSSGPTELDSNEKKGGLLGATTIAQSIVAYGSAPDSPSLTVGPSPNFETTAVISSSVEAIDAYKSKKTTVTAAGPFSLTSPSKKAGLLGEVSVVESIVAFNANPDALSTTVISSEVTAIDSAKSKKTTATASGPTELHGKSMQEFGIASASESIVSDGATISPTFNTLKLDVTPIDSAKSKKSEVVYDSTEILDGYQYDPDLNLIVHTTKEIIEEGTEALSLTNGLLAYRDEPINAWQSIRIQSKISSLPAARTEYKTGAYASPNLLTGFTVLTNQMPNWDINISVTPVMRAKRSYQTVFKHITSYEYSQPILSDYTLFDPIAINVYFDGYFFKVNVPEALTDPDLSISFTTASNDPIHGYINETYHVPVSTTTASAGLHSYSSKIGSYQLIAYEIDYWKANIWRVTEQWVLLK